jgi:fructose-1,6-bisphosphatase/inositol monophosphatase family enzyme
VYKAGLGIRSANRAAEVKAGEGHRSIVTKADIISNDCILKTVNDPDAVFLSEETAPQDRRVLKRDDPVGLFAREKVGVVDPLDGTARFAGNFPDWCVAGGSLSYGKILGSAITAPDNGGGLTLFSTKGEGVLCRQGSREPKPVGSLKRISSAESVVLRGVDTELYANILAVMPKLAASVRAVYTEGSGLFGLMSVTLGNASVIIQTPQKAWDWVPGYHALTEVGGIFKFFRLNAGHLIPVAQYDFEAFTYKKEHRLGFVAGEPVMVEKLFNLLPREGWERHDPDTI